MICPHCKKENKEELRYCSFCGNYINGTFENEDDYLEIQAGESEKDDLQPEDEEEFVNPFKKRKYDENSLNESNKPPIFLMLAMIMVSLLIVTSGSHSDFAAIANLIFIAVVLSLLEQNKSLSIPLKTVWFLGNVIAKALMVLLIYHYFSDFYYQNYVSIQLLTGVPGVLACLFADKNILKVIKEKVIDRYLVKTG